MMQVLLVAAWVASALAAFGAALAWSAARGRDGVSRAVAWLVAVLGFAPLAWVAGHWFHLRWTLGDYDALVGLGGVGLAVHAIGLAALLRAARRSGWGTAPVPWIGAALVGAALSLLLFGQLDLRGRLLAAQLRLEGGELARELLAPPARPEEDAWPLYVELQAELAEVVAGRAWSADVRHLRSGDAIDLADPALVERLEAAAPILDRARAASLLAACDFAGRRSGGRDHWSESEGSPITALALGGGWLLEGLAAAASDRTELALEDVAALLRLSEQAAASPLLIDLMTGYALRRDALQVLAAAAAEASDEQLAQLRDAWPGGLVPRAVDAMDMELAWSLSTFGLLGEGYTMADEPGHWSSEVDTSLYLAFRFGRDVAGYRAVMAACRELCAGTLADVARERESGALARSAREQGVLAMIAVPNVSNQLWGLHQLDARMQLAAQALAALESDREAALVRGTWTADDPAWGDDPPVFELAGPR